MSILLTHPGRYGDLLWGMAVARAIATANGPVDLVLSGKYNGLADLSVHQAYIHSVYTLPDWVVQETAPMTPREPPRSPEGWSQRWDRVIHLGYKGWPSCPLPQYMYQTVQEEHPDLPLAPLDLETPWITPPEGATRWFMQRRRYPPRRIAVGFSDEHFELKYGLAGLMDTTDLSWDLSYACGSPRWSAEGGEGTATWGQAAQIIDQSEVFLGCCSALHVLAVALGTPVVLMEPNPQRHHPIFYPLGTTGRVKLVLGNDGQPTFDSRHVREYLEQTLKEVR